MYDQIDTMVPTGQGAALADEVGTGQNMSQHTGFEPARALNAKSGLPPSDLNAALEQEEVPPKGEPRTQPQCKLTIKNPLTLS